MEILSTLDMLKQVCSLSHKWGMLIVFSQLWEDENINILDELCTLAPYLSYYIDSEYPSMKRSIIYGHCFLLFDTKEEMAANYSNTGTEIYALTCDTEGNFMYENTEEPRYV